MPASWHILASSFVVTTWSTSLRRHTRPRPRRRLDSQATRQHWERVHGKPPAGAGPGPLRTCPLSHRAVPPGVWNIMRSASPCLRTHGITLTTLSSSGRLPIRCGKEAGGTRWQCQARRQPGVP